MEAARSTPVARMIRIVKRLCVKREVWGSEENAGSNQAFDGLVMFVYDQKIP